MAIAPVVAKGGPAPSVLGIIDGNEFTVKDVADMLDFCEELDIRSMDDFDAASDTIRGPVRRELKDARRLAESLGHLPEHRPREYGGRLLEKHSHRSSESSYRRHSSYTPAHSASAQSYSHVEIGER